MSFLSSLFCNTLEKDESSNFFFHFTSEIEHLISIMNDNFIPFYCMESLNYLDMTELGIEEMAYPVVCFCDLPLSRHKEPRRNFGVYGIGLKKKWGLDKNNHLTPVIYSHENSVTSANLKNLFELSPLVKEKLFKNDYSKYENSVSTLMMHYKPYEGYRYNKEERRFSENKTRFYNEREWRYIPLDVNGLKLNLTMKEYLEEKTLTEENLKIQKDNKIKFVLNDIEYIFLKTKSQKKDFLSKLRPKYNKDDLRKINKKIRFK